HRAAHTRVFEIRAGAGVSETGDRPDLVVTRERLRHRLRDLAGRARDEDLLAGERRHNGDNGERGESEANAIAHEGLRPVYASNLAWPDAPAGTSISGLKTPLRWSSVKRPWIISNAASGSPSGIVASCRVACATSHPCRSWSAKAIPSEGPVFSMTPGLP